jgi:transcriptional regulator with XRE-family HTH domain
LNRVEDISDTTLGEVGRKFGENLAARRHTAGISQKVLSIRSGLHRTTIGQLERGERVPNIDTLIRLARALDIGTEALLAGIHFELADVA